MKKILIVGIVALLFLAGCRNSVKTSIDTKKISKITIDETIIDKKDYDFFANKLNKLNFKVYEEDYKEGSIDIYIDLDNEILSFYLYEDGTIVYQTNKNSKKKYVYNDKSLTKEIIDKTTEILDYKANLNMGKYIIKYNENAINGISDNDPSSIELNDDGTYNFSVNMCSKMVNVNGKYEIDKNNLIFTSFNPEVGSVEEFMEYVNDDNTLKFIILNEDEFYLSEIYGNIVGWCLIEGNEYGSFQKDN